MMQIIKIEANSNGSHENQTLHGVLPDGYAVIPTEMKIPDTFPFVDITVDYSGDMPVISSMTERAVPENDNELRPDSLTRDERIASLEMQLEVTQEVIDSILMGNIKI